MTDERLGLPSASNWHRYEACPGSWQLEQIAKDLGQDYRFSSPETERGTRIHAWLADQSVTLQGEELEAAQELLAKADKEVDRIFADQKINVLTEKRLWLRPVVQSETVEDQS